MFAAIENKFHDTFLAVMDNVALPKVEYAVKSNFASSGREVDSKKQNRVHGFFSGNTEDTLLMTASYYRVINLNYNRNEETRLNEFTDGKFPLLRSNLDR